MTKQITLSETDTKVLEKLASKLRMRVNNIVTDIQYEPESGKGMIICRGQVTMKIVEIAAFCNSRGLQYALEIEAGEPIVKIF